MVSSSPLGSLIASGTKLWLDSVDPELVRSSCAYGATGATSNPIIISELIKSGRYDRELEALLSAPGASDDEVAWKIASEIVAAAEGEFLRVWEETAGDDGYVSFELDPLLEDPACPLSHAERVARYIELGKHWSAGHCNRMIKVPATPAGLDALEDLCAAGVALNVTLIFTMRQYEAAREAVWRGAQRRASLDEFKSVYSIFVSRVDVYTESHVPELSADAQGQVGIVGAKRMWISNQQFWADRPTPLRQEIIFASTGTKRPEDPPYKYVQALAGSDIQTNPPATNDAVQASGLIFRRTVDVLPPANVLAEIDSLVDLQKLEEQLMREGVVKFAEPQKSLLSLIVDKRRALGLG